jgi:cell division protein ZapA
MEKKKVNVKIFGNDYTMMGVESEEYIHRVAYQVDKKMRELSEANPKLAISTVAVLVAVNAIDEMYKQKEGLLEKEKEIQKPIEELERTKGQLDILKQQLSANKGESERLRNKLEQYQKMITLLRERENKVKEELDQSKMDINNSMGIISEFETKLFEKENEIKELRREFDEYINTFGR